MTMTEHGPECNICGAILTWVECDYCDGLGEIEDTGERCEECAGDGGQYLCLSLDHDSAATTDSEAS